MLAISTEAQARADKSSHDGIRDEDRVIRVSHQATALGLAGLGLLRRLLLRTLGHCVLGLALKTLRLGGRLDLLVEEVRVDGLDVGRVDVDQGGRALGFILVDTAEGGGATDYVEVVSGAISVEQVCVGYKLTPVGIWLARRPSRVTSSRVLTSSGDCLGPLAAASA
jgi:hypothetical protein